MAKKTKTKKPRKTGVRDFIRRKIVANDKITDTEIADCWKALNGTPLKKGTISRERTIFENLNEFDQKKGLIDFFSSQTELLIKQYENIEQLLGPTGSDWTWSGEHCETLLREAIQKMLPPSLCIGKGYVYGLRTTELGLTRSPEIDILIYDRDQFAPVFSMGHFVIVRAESVRAAIQVKRTLDAGTLGEGVKNVVAAKQHVLASCQFNGSTTTEKMFAAVVSFAEGVQLPTHSSLSETYGSTLKPRISEFHHGYTLPDFVGSLTGFFLHFPGVNVNEMLYQVFRSSLDGKNIALPFLLYMLVKKVMPTGCHLLPAFPEKMAVFGHVPLWKAP